VEDLDVLKATFALYNDWAGDYCKQPLARLFPLASVQLYDLDQA